MKSSNALQTMSFENLKAYWQTLAMSSEGVCQQNEAITVLRIGALQPLLNPVFLEKGANLSTYKNCAHPHSFWHDDKRNESVSALQNTHEVLLSDVPMMVKTLGDELTVQLPEGLQIKLIQDNTDLSEWIAPVARCFEIDEISAKAYQQALESNPEKFKHVAVYDGNQIIGTGTIFCHTDTAGFYNLAVLPEYRNQGIAKAIHHTRFNLAKALDYTHVTLQATPMATKLDSKLGFETCSHMTIYKM